jgi:hypothetical protein
MLTLQQIVISLFLTTITSVPFKPSVASKPLHFLFQLVTKTISFQSNSLYFRAYELPRVFTVVRGNVFTVRLQEDYIFFGVIYLLLSSRPSALYSD